MSVRPPPLVIAHRGASGQRPENTLPAYELAIEMASDCIEIDLHRTRDGQVVITHDEELIGLGGAGEIADATLDDIRMLDAGGGEKVPTLDEVLDRFGKRIPFNLELKRGTREAYPGLPADALAAVTSRGLLDQTLFSSFYDPVLKELRGLREDARLALLISRRFPDRWSERAQALGAEALNPADTVVDEGMIDRAHELGLAVYVYTVDAPRRMERLLDWGVDGLFTNHPDRMRALLDRRHS